MKTAAEMLNERLTIQDGVFKGARITISESVAKELMEDYHSQFCQKIELPGEEELTGEEESKICYLCNVASSK
jgi:hypothetical protein